MSVTDWFRRLFSSGTATADREAIAPAPGGMAGGVSPLAGLEDAAAVEGIEEETEAPSDPAP